MKSMFKNASYFVLSLVIGIMPLLVLSCSDDDEPTYPDLSLEKSQANLYIGESVKIKILSGSGEYTTQEISDVKVIVKASADRENVTIQGVAAGDAVVKIIDVNSRQEKSISIKVEEKFVPEELILDKTEVSIEEKETIEVKILSGNGGYTFDIDESVAKATLEEDIFRITGVKEGVTTLEVVDSEGITAPVSVTVSAEFIPVMTLHTTKTWDNTQEQVEKILCIIQ